MTVNVLLTGAGGNLAHFIHNALIRSNLDVRIVGCDWSHEAVGLYLADTGYVVPSAKSSEYLPRIVEICRQERIHVIMPGGMVEQRVLAANAELIERECGAFVASSVPDSLRRMEDKWELAVHLRASGFDAPRSVLPQDEAAMNTFLAEVPFPYIVKDRFGGGSQGLGVAYDGKRLDYLVETIPNPVVQEYLYPDDQEYTVGVFTDRRGKAAASIVMKRSLNLGMTAKAEVLPDSPLGSYCEKVVESAGCIGPANVQLRLTDRGPVVFEINPRFSSTTSARAYYGYNEPEMVIRHFVLGENIRRPVVRPGRFFRVIEDVFVDPCSVSEMEKKKLRANRLRGEQQSATPEADERMEEGVRL